MSAPKYHYPADDSLLCGCDSFRAMADARDACLKCQGRLEDLLHALRTICNEADWSGYDKRTVRALEFAFLIRAKALANEAGEPEKDSP